MLIIFQLFDGTIYFFQLFLALFYWWVFRSIWFSFNVSKSLFTSITCARPKLCPQRTWYQNIFKSYDMLHIKCTYDISYISRMWSVWSYVKRNKRRERRYSQKLNLDDMKKAIQIQKDIKVKVSTSHEKMCPTKTYNQLRRIDSINYEEPKMF